MSMLLEDGVNWMIKRATRCPDTAILPVRDIMALSSASLTGLMGNQRQFFELAQKSFETYEQTVMHKPIRLQCVN